MVQLNKTGINPEASITVNKSRKKIYPTTGTNSKDKITNNYSIYLNDGQKFEIELYNPTSEEIAAQIYINGNNIHTSGIILKPNERIFLERYIDEDKAFVFESLVVEESNNSLQKLQQLLKNIGKVSVTFHKKIEETKWNEYIIPNRVEHHYYNYKHYPYYYDNVVWCSAIGTSTASGIAGTTGGYGLAGINANNSIQSSTTDSKYSKDYGNRSHVSECKSEGINASNNNLQSSLGIVGKGEETGQEIHNAYSINKFNIESFYELSFQLLSTKDKAVEVGELRSYCTGCGTKLKTNWKFCSSCGTKI